MALTITSPAFAHNGEIPKKYTCDGDDVSPALAWAGVPEGTKSLALIVDDPDAPDPAAPQMTWVHWVLYNIPPDATALSEAVAPTALPAGRPQRLEPHRLRWTVPADRAPPLLPQALRAGHRAARSRQAEQGKA